jgi:hypothetical protein
LIDIVVVNRHTYQGKDAVYVGRPSPLGNPYRIEGESSRGGNYEVSRTAARAVAPRGTREGHADFAGNAIPMGRQARAGVFMREGL